MTDATDSTVNPSAGGVQVITIVDTPNVDALATLPARTSQQHIIPNAVQNRFLNMVQQWPQPTNPNLITSDDFKATDPQLISSDSSIAGSVSAFNFIFQNTNTQPVFVEWCGTLFIDGPDPINAYPEPGQTQGSVRPTDWQVEWYKAAYFGTGLPDAGVPFAPNQVNQDSQWFIVKFVGTGTHEIQVQYYWRTIVNQGGSATPTTLGQ